MPLMGREVCAGFDGGTHPVPFEPVSPSASSPPLSAEVKRGAYTFNFEVQ